MEGFDIINVSENSLFLAGDVRRCIRTVCMLQVMGGEEFHLLDKL